MSDCERDAAEAEITTSGSPLVKHDHGVRRFVDASGASIVEHADGRFRLNPWNQEWEPIDA